MNVIENQIFDEERSLYNLKDTIVSHCLFQGEKDGESVLKEAKNIKVQDTNFSLRYPLWHVVKYELTNCQLDELTRAPIWYSHQGIIDHCSITSIKALRECSHTVVTHCHIDSKEFGWKCHDIELNDTTINSEYIFLDSKNIKLKNVKYSGKYSFQYMDHLLIEDSYLDTKDAFWHSHDVVVRNSTLKGEYLGWFSDGLTLINCKIIGTQPLCYCKNLKLINCEMIDTDLSFEYSEVEADIIGHVDSIKNPGKGLIVVYPVEGKVEIRR